MSEALRSHLPCVPASSASLRRRAQTESAVALGPLSATPPAAHPWSQSATGRWCPWSSTAALWSRGSSAGSPVLVWGAFHPGRRALCRDGSIFPAQCDPRGLRAALQRPGNKVTRFLLKLGYNKHLWISKIYHRFRNTSVEKNAARNFGKTILEIDFNESIND